MKITHICIGAVIVIGLVPRSAAGQGGVGSTALNVGPVAPLTTPAARGPSSTVPVPLISGNQCVSSGPSVSECRHFVLARSGKQRTVPALRYVGEEVKTRLAADPRGITGAWIRVCDATFVDWVLGCQTAPELPAVRALDGERVEHFDGLDVANVRNRKLLYLGWSFEQGKLPAARSIPFELEIK